MATVRASIAQRGTQNQSFIATLRANNIITNNISFASSNNTVAINVGIHGASNYKQGTFAVAIGSNAGLLSQGEYSVAIGSESGSINQGSQSVAIGIGAGNNIQGIYSLAIGYQGGQDNQGIGALAIGYNAGQTSQLNFATAIGALAGQYMQGYEAISIGANSANYMQGESAVAIGTSAGSTGQGAYSVSIGTEAGFQNQGTSSTAIGFRAGWDTQSNFATSVGYQAGLTFQGANSVCIGFEAGKGYQGSNSVSIGYQAGQNNQGANAVAIGSYAGQNSQNDNTIVINATGSALDTTNSNGIYMAPVRANAGNYSLKYNTTTSEITYDTAKTFVIDHPTDKDKYLVHACLEGPEAGVYYRGRVEIPEDERYIEVVLLEYVDKLAKSFTINLTQVFESDEDNFCKLSCSKVSNNKFKIYKNKKQNVIVDWTVFGKRLEILTEVNKYSAIVKGNGPYKFI